MARPRPRRAPRHHHGLARPRFVATALAAGLLYRRRTGRGAYLDLGQVEAAVWSLTPWLLDHLDGVTVERMGNRSRRAVPHGAFPCAGKDRWVDVAVWTDEEWERLAAIVGVADPDLATLDRRRARVDEVEAAVAAWTSHRRREEVAETLQAAGIEAVPVADFGDLHDDPQLAHRGHFVPLTHPVMGPRLYERNGFRPSSAPSGYDRTGPTLGQDNDWVLSGLLGLDRDEIDRLAAGGALD
ncbi:MAG: CoA transferase [Acidimicrobiia bacterium]|nr:CoA transferase [Acidimicrobiia bacterium]